MNTKGCVLLVPIDTGLASSLGSPDFETGRNLRLGGQRADVVARTLALYERSPREDPWLGFLAADAVSRQIVGACGFVGPISGGAIEIAYATFPGFEGRGYATAMAQELVWIARVSSEEPAIIAHTLPERNASTRILEKLGFFVVGTARDADAREVWQWRLDALDRARVSDPAEDAG